MQTSSHNDKFCQNYTLKCCNKTRRSALSVIIGGEEADIKKRGLIISWLLALRLLMLELSSIVRNLRSSNLDCWSLVLLDCFLLKWKVNGGCYDDQNASYLGYTLIPKIQKYPFSPYSEHIEIFISAKILLVSGLPYIFNDQNKLSKS